MIKSFDVRGFRGFDDLSLKGLRLINIVVGRSASGKTALLESLRLALGATPNIAWSLNASRGIFVHFQSNMSREQFEALWSPFFFDFDVERTISFKLVNTQDQEASTKIYFDKSKPVTPTLPAFPGAQMTPSTIIPLAFDRISFDKASSTLYGTISPQGQMQLEQGQELVSTSEYFPSTWQSNAPQIAGWFSQLSIDNREENILKVVAKEFPEITDLSVQAPSNIPILHATVKYRTKKMPVSLISSGINKFIAVIMAIQQFKGGVVLIDEIENGIYYAMFPSFWEAIYRFAKQNNTQLFLSTHSWECLKTVAPLIEKAKDDFCLVQVFQQNGFSNARTVLGEDAAAAIDSDIEVRK